MIHVGDRSDGTTRHALDHTEGVGIRDRDEDRSPDVVLGQEVGAAGGPSDRSLVAQPLVYQLSQTIFISGYRTYKLCSDTNSEYGRYVKSLGEPVAGMTNAVTSLLRGSSC